MANAEPAVFFHADDYGITLQQAKDILALSSACGGTGALNSISIFANSPAYEESLQLAKPFVKEGKIEIGLHLNLVEGRCLSNPLNVPLLVNDQGFFKNDFLSLLRLSKTKQRNELLAQISHELAAQIKRFIESLPSKKESLHLDSHQHTHCIPLVFQGLLDALNQTNAKVSCLRAPLDPLLLYRKARINSKGDIRQESSVQRPPLINRAKILLINRLRTECETELVPWSDAASDQSPLFCGIAFSGCMSRFNKALLNEFKNEAAHQNRSLEILFHPVSVPLDECLDPSHTAFAEACASTERDLEASVLREL